LKKQIIVCDATGDEGVPTLTLSFKHEVKKSFLDSAGDSDYEMILETFSLDLSHLGAIKLLQELCKNSVNKELILKLTKHI
jgi:hypothetical protein